jgi:hypothetical protein
MIFQLATSGNDETMGCFADRIEAHLVTHRPTT